MNLTIERTELLGKYLQEDVDRAKMLVELEPEEAVKKINADGYDFTVEELIEFGEHLKAAGNDELTEESLSDVSGGVLAAGAAAVYVACIALGVNIGINIKKW